MKSYIYTLLGAVTVKVCYHMWHQQCPLSHKIISEWPLDPHFHAACWMTEVKIMQILTSLSCPMWNPKFVSYWVNVLHLHPYSLDLLPIVTVKHCHYQYMAEILLLRHKTLNNQSNDHCKTHQFVGGLGIEFLIIWVDLHVHFVQAISRQSCDVQAVVGGRELLTVAHTIQEYLTKERALWDIIT